MNVDLVHQCNVKEERTIIKKVGPQLLTEIKK